MGNPDVSLELVVYHPTIGYTDSMFLCNDCYSQSYRLDVMHINAIVTANAQQKSFGKVDQDKARPMKHDYSMKTQCGKHPNSLARNFKKEKEDVCQVRG